jgi:membrane-associated phospholipid phosphatase
MRKSKIIPLEITIPYLVFFISASLFLFAFDQLEGQKWINQFHSPFFDTLFKYLTKLVEEYFLIPFFIVLLLYSFRHFLYLLFAFAISGGITQFLKRQIFNGENRPWYHFEKEPDYHFIDFLNYHGNMSFPSGHTTTAFAVFIAIALISKYRFLKFSFTILAIFVGFSRVYLSFHFVRDILLGSIIGSLAAVLFYFLFYNSSFKVINKIPKNRGILKLK